MKFTEIIENLLPRDHTAEVIKVEDSRTDINGRTIEKGWYIQSTEDLPRRDLLDTMKWDYREKIGECTYNYYRIET